MVRVCVSECWRRTQQQHEASFSVLTTMCVWYTYSESERESSLSYERFRAIYTRQGNIAFDAYTYKYTANWLYALSQQPSAADAGVAETDEPCSFGSLDATWNTYTTLIQPLR